MELRDKKVTVKMTAQEHEFLLHNAKISNIKISTYIRTCISKSEVKTDNSKDYIKLVTAVNRVGNNINQIARVLNIAKNENKLSEQNFNLYFKFLYIAYKQLKNLRGK